MEEPIRTFNSNEIDEYNDKIFYLMQLCEKILIKDFRYCNPLVIKQDVIDIKHLVSSLIITSNSEPKWNKFKGE